ncbi:MAG: LPS export ABC transporter periplasmic protein LptC [Alistipes sp.]|nr:LPS export ABC transporter periplasmic protein LptC [Alistipes sp.]
MLIHSLRRYLAVALPFAGSAILLFSCQAKPAAVEQAAMEALMTEYSENMSITMSENGRKSYHFETPLIEGYSMAHDPYREFRKGIKITIYDENTGAESATLTANYAIFYEDRKLWEAKGDVVATNSDGRQLFTSQLFWNQATHKVYSNVDSKIVDGDEVHHCEGFESDEAMKDWTYRKLKGVTYIEDSDLTTSDADSTKTVEPAPVVTPPVAPSSNVTRPRTRQLPTLKERVERGEATPNEVQLPITTIEKR